MKKHIYSFILLLFISGTLLAQVANRADFQKRTKFTKPVNRSAMNLAGGPMIVDTLASLVDISNYLFGPGVTVTNLTYSGPTLSIGIFTDTTHTFGIDTGIVMTTGCLANVPGPNNSTSASYNNNLPGDLDLDNLIPGYTTYDASIIEFDFTPQTDTLIAAKFIFGSEEYLEFVGSVFNDVFGFFISGPGFYGNENIAVVDTTHTNVCINTINDLAYSQYYVNNDTGQVVQYDGYTTVIQAMHTIIPGQTYHFKIAIADGGDHVYDAGVFLKAGSFLSYAMMPTAGFDFSVVGDTVTFLNRTNYAKEYLWDFGDGNSSTDVNPVHSYTVPGKYEVELSARNYYQVNTFRETVTV